MGLMGGSAKVLVGGFVTFVGGPGAFVYNSTMRILIGNALSSS